MSGPTHEATPPAPPAPPERQSTPFLVMQFFIFPLAIVAVCVMVFVVFGLIASEGKGARDYLAEVRSGSANRRWQAAFELAKRLQSGRDPELADPRFVSEIVALLDESGRDDPRVRRYLALALGRLGNARAVPSLIEAVRQAELADATSADSETLIYAVWALGAIGDAAAVPELARLTGSADPGIRKAAAHALGAFESPLARQALQRALRDAAADVRWNAALALARQRDASALPVLLQMLDRRQLADVPGLSPEQTDAVILQAVQASGQLAQPALRGALEGLRRGDPSLRIREAARVALETTPPAAP